MERRMPMSGNVVARRVALPGPGLLYRLRNLPNILRGAWRKKIADLLEIPMLYAELSAVLVKANGRRINYGRVATRVVTDAFVAELTDELHSGVAAFNDYKYHASGTDNTAEAAGDTALGAEQESRATGTQTEGASANQYQSVGTVSYTGSLAIVEHGLFNADPAGTLMDRSVFAAINVQNGDSIEFTYTLTAQAGG